MILSVSKFGKTGHNGCKVAGICFFKLIQKILDGASARRGFVKFYCKFHFMSTSILVYMKILGGLLKFKSFVFLTTDTHRRTQTTVRYISFSAFSLTLLLIPFADVVVFEYRIIRALQSYEFIPLPGGQKPIKLVVLI